MGKLAGSLNKTPLAFLTAADHLKQHKACLEPNAIVFVVAPLVFFSFLGKNFVSEGDINFEVNANYF